MGLCHDSHRKTSWASTATPASGATTTCGPAVLRAAPSASASACRTCARASPGAPHRYWGLLGGDLTQGPHPWKKNTRTVSLQLVTAERWHVLAAVPEENSHVNVTEGQALRFLSTWIAPSAFWGNKVKTYCLGGTAWAHAGRHTKYTGTGTPL